MIEYDDILNQIRNGGFLTDFISDNERQKKHNVTVITSACKDLIEASDEERTTEYIVSCTERILRQCSQMLKFSDIFNILLNIADENDMLTEQVNISKFLSEFAADCQLQLQGKCEISYITSTDDVTETAKKLLELCAIMYVRQSVLKGAESISFTNTLEADHVVIHAEIVKLGSAFERENMTETFTFDYADDIISSIVKKMNGKFVSTDREMKLYIPLKNSGYSILNSPPKTLGKSFFNIFKNMLSDLGNITII